VEEREFLRAIGEVLAEGDWGASRITGGETSPNTFRITCDGDDLFAKEIRDNERSVLSVITPMGLSHIQKVMYPELLRHNILVTEYVDAGHISGMNLEDSVVGDMAAIQNHFFRAAPSKEPDRELWGSFLDGHLRRSKARLTELAHGYGKAVTRYVEIHGPIEEEFESIRAAYTGMPFRKLHNDFREANILASSPQKVIDWGSCYGDGPLLYDLAPFMMNDTHLTDIYRTEIAGLEGNTDGEFTKWLLVSGAARFLSFLTYIDAHSTESGIAETLDRNYHVWQKLVDEDHLRTVLK